MRKFLDGSPRIAGSTSLDMLPPSGKGNKRRVESRGDRSGSFISYIKHRITLARSIGAIDQLMSRIVDGALDRLETLRDCMHACIEGTAKDLFLYIEDSNVATIEELAKHIGAEPELILQHVDLLYSVGLIHRVGKAYFVREPVSTSIVRRLIPRITENLRKIAKAESRSRSDTSYYYKMRGRAFSEVGSAIAACKEISHTGGSPIARVVGIHSFNNESVEVEGPVSNYGYSPQHLVVITESGGKVVVGNKNSKGADVQAH